uniref:BZIP domain-containing protein n=1 Tax=Panagrolaimus sp. ES5 TaxID=591445 RepID=A0AC34F7R4_9BILA
MDSANNFQLGNGCKNGNGYQNTNNKPQNLHDGTVGQFETANRSQQLNNQTILAQNYNIVSQNQQFQQSFGFGRDINVSQYCDETRYREAFSPIQYPQHGYQNTDPNMMKNSDDDFEIHHSPPTMSQKCNPQLFTLPYIALEQPNVETIAEENIQSGPSKVTKPKQNLPIQTNTTTKNASKPDATNARGRPRIYPKDKNAARKRHNISSKINYHKTAAKNRVYRSNLENEVEALETENLELKTTLTRKYSILVNQWNRNFPTLYNEMPIDQRKTAEKKQADFYEICQNFQNTHF